ncbi:ExbD/TolR family protein [Pseudaeromonas sharmana]|uniref:ExbD/TolR family protein n=1 Tax=Pseudaeromonas sharmana TaxID=328412 RepID=A0ABV8CKN3_9GAMM
MAFGKFSAEDNFQPSAEINMIPMIDVMLVLLIVFMITAPLMTHSVQLELPQASSTINKTDEKDISLAIDAEGHVYWNGQKISNAQLSEKLQQTAQIANQPQLQIQADKHLNYGRLVEIISEASRLGVHKLAFVSDPAQ